MRAQKHNTSVDDGSWMSLTPMVHSCKLHLTTVKSLPEGAQGRTASQDVKEKYMNIMQTIHPLSESGLHAYSQRVPAQVPLVLSFPSEAPYFPNNQGPAAGGGTRGHGYRKAVHGFPFIQLTSDRHASSFQRVDMDRRCLEECPQLGCMDGLQFLNLQHNLITAIHHLSHLQQLVFLNLFDNHISEMTGIETLGSLRILMLGKNRIHKIGCLENLCRLNILDLHDNQICRIENVSHLSELRVLNLAGNRISRVEKIQGLDCLTELNLRHNCISVVTEVDRLPCLQRLFLSCNNITSFDQLACLGESRFLSELTLDGNPVALETWYKQAVLRCVPHLRQLDMKRITDEDRRMAGLQARKEEEKKRESHKQTIHKEKRRLAIRNAAQQWEGVRACLELQPTNGAKEDVSPENSPAHSPAQTNGLALEPSPDEPRRISPGSGPERPSGGTESRLRTNSRPNSPREPK